MRLDTKALRYLTGEDWRVLTAVETGSRNHEVVPTALIGQIAGLRSGLSVDKNISVLAKANLVSRTKNAKYDGYRLTYGGLDYLALHAHTKKDHVFSVGNQIGVGKESDIFVVADPDGRQRVLKIHRLGRISFRTVKTNRDYLRGRHSGSWMYMSRLAALKEFTFMKALREAGFPVPEPISQNRHTIVMELIDAFPLRQIKEVPDPAALYNDLMEMILKLASVGLIHCDFNEFNILVKEVVSDREAERQEDTKTNKGQDGEESTAKIDPNLSLVPIIIDFPQMVSISHPEAENYFNRDVACIKKFFSRRFGFTSDSKGPTFKQGMKAANSKGAKRLDTETEASGFSRKMEKDLQKYMQELKVKDESNMDGEVGESSEEEDQSEQESDEADGDTK